MVHCGGDRQHVFFDRAAGSKEDWNQVRDGYGAEDSCSAKLVFVYVSLFM